MMNIKRTDVNSAQIKLYENTKKENINNKTDKNKSSSVKIFDKINISAEAKNLSIIDFAKSIVKSDIAKDLTDINSERINAIKEQIKNGTYSVSSKDIAAAVISGGEV